VKTYRKKKKPGAVLYKGKKKVGEIVDERAQDDVTGPQAAKVPKKEPLTVGRGHAPGRKGSSSP